MEKIKSNNSSIVFGTDGYESFLSSIKLKSYSSIFILVDENTKKHCLPVLLRENLDFSDSKIILIKSGEKNKNINTCERIWIELSDNGADRNSMIINLGGGVITDLGGFVASTFKRGIHFYNIPTTLLSMVDASVGGKTGINLGSLKNQVGIIIDPKMVLIDPKWLKTLDQREIISGYAEMLKHGLIFDVGYWNSLSKIEKISHEQLEPFIITSILLKNSIITKDPYEKGIRKILNFGHTLGHAIESYFLNSKTKKSLLHGEAIAIGMVLESYLSSILLGLNKQSLIQIKDVISSNFPKIKFNKRDIENIIILIQHDKKNIAGKVNFVLLKTIGEAKVNVVLDYKIIHKAFSFWEE